MSIKKQFLKSKPVCKVTFLADAQTVGSANKVVLSGEFNDWSLDKDPMVKQKNGTFKLVKELPAGKRFQFRYVVDDHDWKNDPEADEYIHSGVAYEDNSVLNLE